jgi:hypothetical protein
MTVLTQISRGLPQTRKDISGKVTLDRARQPPRASHVRHYSACTKTLLNKLTNNKTASADLIFIARNSAFTFIFQYCDIADVEELIFTVWTFVMGDY